MVDNASSDNTQDVVNNFLRDCTNFKVQALFEAKLGKTHALNMALNNVSGDILALVDDDHIVSKDYLNALYGAAKEHPSINLFCGRILPNWDGTEPRWVHDNKRYPIRPFPIPCFDLGGSAVEITLKGRMFLPGAGNLVIRMSVLQRIGLFSEQLGPKGHNLRGGEDIEFIRRALGHGEKLLYVPEILQYHQVEQSKLTFCYVVKKAYLRSIAANQFSNHSINIPFYLFRQAVERFIKALFAVNKDARRYYFTKLAVTLGEIQGIRKSRKHLPKCQNA